MGTARYLTAQKISLLVLLQLYCSSTLPSSATIPILSFIISNTLPPTSSSARSQRSSASQDSFFPIDSFEEVLQGHASNMPGRTLLDIFLKSMWEMNSFDALHSLFDNLGELLMSPPNPEGEVQERVYLSKTSPLGIFVRRARLEFDRLKFEDTIALWSSFVKYRAPTAKWTKRLAGLAASGVDAVVADMGLQEGDDVYEIAYGALNEPETGTQGMSLDDLDRILEFQLERLQRFGDRVPEAMRTQLRGMFASSDTVHQQAHLVNFFDAWKAGDYTTAFDNLHRYYDYAMQTREKVHYQYALLHTAILQADFGCFGEAIAAINETIATARESQDMTCLSFSLSWLSHMNKAYPKQMKSAGYISMLGSERDALAFLKAKARETKMYNLLSATLLNEAKLSLSTGDSISRAFEHIYQSSHLNIRETINHYGSQILLQSTLYSRLGIPHLANVHCELLLDCHGARCPVDEKLRAVGRQAFIMSQSGRYDDAIEAFELINAASQNKALKSKQYIILCVGIIKLKRAIRRSDWSTCSHLLATLKPSTGSSADALDPELHFLLSEAYIDFLVSKGDYAAAFTAISSLAESLKEDNADILQRISVLLMKADLFRRAGKPEHGFSVALRAASVAYKAKLMPSLWTAVGLLANILNNLGECASAKRLLEAVLPHSLENGDNMLSGTLYSHLGDSFMGLADPAKATEPRLQTSYIAKAELYIDRARDCFKKSSYLDGECEQLMKKAIIAKLRGDEKLAEEWSQNHNRVWEEGMKRIEQT
ncbi:anaphase-promoting complex subunit 5-domain-containing protein [Boeremia exigua]|uniref:anaphase-promoting complex subunit 5-domain-containing protein n=1 Tax=Boeremia exigua TaxID=749465 RepID=UPI001E8D7E78|nr:anaphase-promoting complex subunit 5-domain-containing protein [Boeremia exigua]KAH6620145.1 anaphase-promoting complex subunit 5-domain-containing protein [Boeremia exigua]